jgi:SAM-dependent methyltransferase
LTAHRPTPPDPLPYPALALGVYAEELANGARVAVFGDATSEIAEELIERGARLVHVFDSDPARIAEATARGQHRSIFYAQLPPGGDVGVRDGAFDFVLVPDLSLTTDPTALLGLLRRVLSPAGAALIATPNFDAKAPLVAHPKSRSSPLGYYDLYDAVAAHFTSVRMIGQAPFVGYAIAEFAASDPEPTIDTSLADVQKKEPDWFLVLAGERNVRLDPFALIEIPKVDLPAFGGRAPLSVVPVSLPRDEARIAELEAARDTALESLRQQEHLVREERLRADRAVSELSASREELALATARQSALQERVTREESRRAKLEIELESARHNPEMGTLRQRIQTLESTQVKLESAAREFSEQRRADERRRTDEERRATGERLATTQREAGEQRRTAEERDAAQAELARVQAELACVQAELPRERGTLEEHAKEIERFEALLRDRGHQVQELEAEVARRDRLVRELIATNVTAEQPPLEPTDLPLSNGTATADLAAQLDQLASEAARREADLVAASWKISQLERELTHQR